MFEFEPSDFDEIAKITLEELQVFDLKRSLAYGANMKLKKWLREPLDASGCTISAHSVVHITRENESLKGLLREIQSNFKTIENLPDTPKWKSFLKGYCIGMCERIEKVFE